MAPLGRGLVFGLNDFVQGEEPFFTDGTPSGTVPLGDLLPGIPSSTPRDLISIGDTCYFTTQNGAKLFMTDGTAAGTSEWFAGVADAPSGFDRTFAVRDRLYFQAYTAANGFELWTSDGTLAGTEMVADLAPGAGGVSIFAYWAMGDLLLFHLSSAGNSTFWRTDGTTAGTFQLADRPPSRLAATGERQAWFSAWDEQHGWELWRTDGTVAGTARFADLLPGDASSNPDSFCFSNGKLLFGAEHPQLGFEPWVVDVRATSQQVGYGCTPTTTIPPRMWSDDPAMGTTIDIHVSRGPEPGISAALISNYTTTTTPLGSGFCDYFVAADAVFLDARLMNGGLATHQLFIPTTPSLLNEQFRLQAITLPAAGLLEAELSNGVTLTIGD